MFESCFKPVSANNIVGTEACKSSLLLPLQEMNSTIYLLLGGNMGDRLAVLNNARHLLSKYCGQILNSSAIYETAAWGKEDQPSFYNMAVELSTVFSPEELLLAIHKIEQELGRVREERWGERRIDIDIIYFGYHQINTPSLQIPHPFRDQRRFVLLPLAEIAATFEDPVLHKTIAALLEACADPLPVVKLAKS